MKTNKKKFFLIIFFSIFAFIINTDITNAKTCYYKNGSNKVELEVTTSSAMWNGSTKLIDNKNSSSIDGNTNYYTMAFYNNTTLTKDNLSESFVCPKYVHTFTFWYNANGYNGFWLTDEPWSNLSSSTNYTMAMNYFIKTDTEHTTYEEYAPVTPPSSGTGTATCSAFKYSLETIYDDGSGGWECEYNNTSTNIKIIPNSEGKGYFYTSTYKTQLINKTSLNITKSSDCPDYIWIKSPTTATAVITFNIYDTSTHEDLKNCSIEDKAGNPVDVNVSQICTYTNLKDSSKSITIKATTESIYMNTGSGSVLVYGPNSSSNTGVVFNDTYINNICDSTYLMYKTTSTTCMSNTVKSKLLSFSTEPQWSGCGDGTYFVDATDSNDSLYQFMYSQETSWENPEYDDPYNSAGNTDSLEISTGNNSGNIACEDLFGTEGNRNNLYDVLHTIITAIRIGTPILLILLTMLDFTKATTNDEALPKAKKHAITRIIIAIVIFLVPSLLNLILDLIGLDSCML